MTTRCRSRCRPDGKRVVVTGPIDRDTRQERALGVVGRVGRGATSCSKGTRRRSSAAAWSKDGKTIVTGDADGVVIAWDAATFKEKSRLALGGRVAAVAISPDGKHSAAAAASPMPLPNEGRDLHRGGVSSGRPRIPPRSRSRPAATTPAGRSRESRRWRSRRTASRSRRRSATSRTCPASGELVGKVRSLRDRTSSPRRSRTRPPLEPGRWTEKAVLTNHAGPVDSVAFAPDGKTFVTGGGRRQSAPLGRHNAQAARTGGGGARREVHRRRVQPDGKLVAATRDKVTGFFDPEKRQPVLMNPPVPRRPRRGLLAGREVGRHQRRIHHRVSRLVHRWRSVRRSRGHARRSTSRPVAWSADSQLSRRDRATRRWELAGRDHGCHAELEGAEPRRPQGARCTPSRGRRTAS